MDGLEWKRSKWGGARPGLLPLGGGVRRPLGRRPHRRCAGHRATTTTPSSACRPSSSATARRCSTARPEDGIRALGLQPGGYHLVVARFEPENHVARSSRATTRAARPCRSSSSARRRTAPSTRGRSSRSPPATRASDLLGGVYDQDLLDALYFHAHTYVHGHSVGGTNPSLLRAMGAGTAVIAYDVGFNHETLDEHGWFFADAAEVQRHFTDLERDSSRVAELGQRGPRARRRPVHLGERRRALRAPRAAAGERRVGAPDRSSRPASRGRRPARHAAARPLTRSARRRHRRLRPPRPPGRSASRRSRGAAPRAPRTTSWRPAGRAGRPRSSRSPVRRHRVCTPAGSRCRR